MNIQKYIYMYQWVQDRRYGETHDSFYRRWLYLPAKYLTTFEIIQLDKIQQHKPDMYYLMNSREKGGM